MTKEGILPKSRLRHRQGRREKNVCLIVMMAQSIASLEAALVNTAVGGYGSLRSR
jgi:hypothetical protein